MKVELDRVLDIIAEVESGLRADDRCVELFDDIYDALEGLYEGEKKIESVNHPCHYSDKFECIDAMIDCFGNDKVKAFCQLNAFKYVWRADKKNGDEDLRKARWYLEKLSEL